MSETDMTEPTLREMIAYMERIVRMHDRIYRCPDVERRVPVWPAKGHDIDCADAILVRLRRDEAREREVGAMSMTVKERERKLRIKRKDWKFGRFGWGVSFHPFIPLGAAFAVKWWPCEQAIAFQASLCMVQGYVYVSVR